MNISEAVEFGKRTLESVIGSGKEHERELTSNVYLLMSSLLEMSIPHIKFNPDIELTKEQLTIFNTWIERRLNMEPIQYITGETEFWSIPIIVGEGVVIPRQDTETLVGEFKKYFDATEGKYKFLDMCCGCGCIGLSLLNIFPQSHVTFADKYPKPIKFTNENIKRHNLDERTEVIMSDMFAELHGKFDGIISNPPYIPSGDLKGLSIEINLFEPIEALKAGGDGLTFHKILASVSRAFLKPNAPLFIEIGYNQSEDVTNIFKNEGWEDIKIVNDLAGNPRVLSAKNSTAKKI